MLCDGCKAESRSTVLWSQGRRGVECPEARLVQASLGSRIRGETACRGERQLPCGSGTSLLGKLVAALSEGCKGHWSTLQESGVALTNCGIWQKQILQQEAAGDLLVQDKAERHEEVEMDNQ